VEKGEGKDQEEEQQGEGKEKEEKKGKKRRTKPILSSSQSKQVEKRVVGKEEGEGESEQGAYTAQINHIPRGQVFDTYPLKESHVIISHLVELLLHCYTFLSFAIHTV